ncbi:C4-dicarboxylate TRAP transporter substrate-binding protein [Citricoccus parietis]|uniref:C4-dicarboxylate TRAP transporter substrate-binding protein n=2 Tax=Citricoccus parietis TaxID=592307 RepID=A0ABV6F4Y9_9MICC
MTTHGQKRPGRRLRALAGAAVALMAGTLAGCGATPSGTAYSEESPLVLRYADYSSATSSGPFQAFADQVTEESDGRIDFKQYWGGSLLGTADMPAGIRGGVADLGMFTATYYGSEFPLTEWISSLGSVSSTEYPDGILQANAAQADFAMNSEAVNEQFEDRGIKLLFSSHSITKYDIICTSPVESLADAKGKRVRSGGALWDRELEAAGMIPVNVAITETYEGLQRGVIDCALASPKTVTAYSLWDVAKYYTEIPLSGINAQYAVMNKDQWEALEPEDQQIVWDAGYTWWLEYLKYEGLGLEEKLRTEGVEDEGVTFLQGEEDLVGAIEDQQEKVIDQMPADAPESVEDPEAVIDEYVSTMDTWLERVQGMDLGTPEDINLSEYEETAKSELWDRNRP